MELEVIQRVSLDVKYQCASSTRILVLEPCEFFICHCNGR